MKLIYTASKKAVEVGDKVVVDGCSAEIISFRPPHKPSSSGKCFIHYPGADPYNREVFVSVIGAEWIEREDQVEDPRSAEDIRPTITDEQLLQIKLFWNVLADVQELKKGSVTYRKSQQLFLQGVVALLLASGQQVPPAIAMALATHRDFTDNKPI